jgi:hypothetical protein
MSFDFKERRFSIADLLKRRFVNRRSLMLQIRFIAENRVARSAERKCE